MSKTRHLYSIVLFKNYRVIAKFLLVMVLFFLSYIAAAFLAHPNWGEILHMTFLPPLHSFTKEYYVAAVGIMGTTITPYLFFWQVKEEIEEHKTKKQALNEAMHEDAAQAPGFVFSQIITLFIIIATGATLHQSGITIHNAADAASALIPVAGNGAGWGRNDYFSLSVVYLGFLALFYFLVLQVLTSPRRWMLVFNVLVSVGAATAGLFVLKAIFHVDIFNWLTGYNTLSNSIEGFNGTFGVWLVIIFVLSAGQLIKKNIGVASGVLYGLAAALTFVGLILLSFKLIWWVI
jgi:Mn2+/Fe2+ NRAMP family transporter